MSGGYAGFNPRDKDHPGYSEEELWPNGRPRPGMSGKWTPEPWNPNHVVLTDANVDRLVACVNACASIPHPEAIPELIEALKDLIAAVSPEPDGTMRRMADRSSRLEWYLDMRPKRDRVSAALAKAGIK